MRWRLWFSIPLVRRLLHLLGWLLIAYGYTQVWAPQGSAEQVTRQVVGGLQAVAAGAGLIALLIFLRIR